jgi:ribosomal protein L12E/L44/L45/RPP1/RPP2
MVYLDETWRFQMGFEDMKVSELKQVAELFGVEVDGNRKASIVKALEQDGVSYDVYLKMAPTSFPDPETPSDKPKVVKQENKILIRMDRANFSYETHGVRFTKEHPFQAVDEDVAADILYHDTGFRIASPHEVEQFYS